MNFRFICNVRVFIVSLSYVQVASDQHKHELKQQQQKMNLNTHMRKLLLERNFFSLSMFFVDVAVDDVRSGTRSYFIID